MAIYQDPRDELAALLSLTGRRPGELARACGIGTQRLCRVLRRGAHLTIDEYARARKVLREWLLPADGVTSA